jgi:hypothetical protein
MRCEAPILFLVFNRPDHTRLALERIRQAQPCRLYVHCDGARAQVAGEQEKVEAVRAVVRALTLEWDVEVFTLYREQNAGLRAGVSGALDWFFGAEPYGIVLEDDCVPDLSFFPFCSELLEKYRDDEQIMHIGGSNLVEAVTADKPASYVFSRFSFVWGWAGWRRAWKKMSADLDGLDGFVRSGRISDLVKDPMAQAYMLDKFRATKARENNSWAYAWFYSILINNGLCLVSSRNLVQNTGVGEAGATNTTGSNPAARRAAGQMLFPLLHPVDRTPDPDLEQQFFYVSQKRRLRLYLWYVLHRLGLR